MIAGAQSGTDSYTCDRARSHHNGGPSLGSRRPAAADPRQRPLRTQWYFRYNTNSQDNI